MAHSPFLRFPRQQRSIFSSLPRWPLLHGSPLLLFSLFSDSLSFSSLRPYDDMGPAQTVQDKLLISRSKPLIILARFLLPCGFPGGSEGKASACDAGDPGSIPGSGRSPGEGNGNPTPVFLPGKSHGPSSLWATVHRVTKSLTRLSDYTLCRVRQHIHSSLGLSCDISLVVVVGKPG